MRCAFLAALTKASTMGPANPNAPKDRVLRRRFGGPAGQILCVILAFRFCIHHGLCEVVAVLHRMEGGTR